VVATIVGSFGAACSLALDYTGIDDGVRDATSGDAPTSADGAVDSSFDSGPHDAQPGSEASTDASVDALPDGPCPNLPGPALVPVYTGCIDSTEVTVAQYTAFLSAKAGDTSGQPDECSGWNTSFLPAGWPPSGADDLPVEYANWCQAYMYCAWAGKTLCGALDGGAADPNAWNDPTQSEWFNACSHNGDGLHTYPYGNNYAPTLCNGADEGADAALSSRVTCLGGFPGLYDMSGNLYEWENSCYAPSGDAAAGPNDFCHVRGGGFTDDSANLRCDNSISVNRSGPSENVGFRCCTN